MREQDYAVAIGDFRSVLRERPVDVRVIKALARNRGNSSKVKAWAEKEKAYRKSLTEK